MASTDNTPGATPTHKRRRSDDNSHGAAHSSRMTRDDGHRDGDARGSHRYSPDGRRASASPRRGDDRHDYYSKKRESSRSPARRRSRSPPTSNSSTVTDSRPPSRSRVPRRSSRSPTSTNRTRSESIPSDQPPLTPPLDLLKPDYRPALALHGHTKPVSQVRLSPNGRYIASASADATVKIWDAATGAHLDTLVGHMAGVSCVAWAPDSNTLASGSDDKAIRLWDRVTGRPKTTTRQSVVARDMAPLRGHHNYIHCLAFSPKGNILASGSYDEAVFLWDVRAGRLMRSLPAHSDPVSGIDVSPDGTLVVSCSTDGLTRIWDMSTGQCLRTLVHEDNPAVTNVCFSPNGRFVLAFNLDNCIRMWDYVQGSVKKTYQGHKNEKFAVGGCFGVLNGVPFIVSASEDGSIVLWDVKSKAVLQKLSDCHKGVCFWVDVHGETMVSAGQDNIVKVYRHGKQGELATNGHIGGELPIRQDDVKQEH